MPGTVLGIGIKKQDGEGPCAQQLTFQWGKIKNKTQNDEIKQRLINSEGLERIFGGLFK